MDFPPVVAGFRFDMGNSGAWSWKPDIFLSLLAYVCMYRHIIVRNKSSKPVN